MIKGGLFSKAIFTEDPSRISNFPNFPTNEIGLIRKNYNRFGWSKIRKNSDFRVGFSCKDVMSMLNNWNIGGIIIIT